MAGENTEAAPTETAESETASTEKDRKNDVTRPTRGVTAEIWHACDDLHERHGRPPTASEVKAACSGKVDATISTQYARWKKYMGITGRVTSPEEEQAKADEEKAKAEAKAAKAKAAADAKAAKEKAAAEAKAAKAAKAQETVEA